MFALEAEDFDPAPSISYCIQNNGASPMEFRTAVQDVVDTDVECTGDEAAFDETCGPGPEGQPRPGELMDSLVLTYFTGNCQLDLKGQMQVGTPHLLIDEVGQPLLLGSLPPVSFTCFEVVLSLDPTAELQAVQSDTVTWRFRWEATLAAPSP